MPCILRLLISEVDSAMLDDEDYSLLNITQEASSGSWLLKFNVPGSLVKVIVGKGGAQKKRVTSFLCMHMVCWRDSDMNLPQIEEETGAKLKLPPMGKCDVGTVW